MDTALDIRAQIDADTHLQTEINHALFAVADGLKAGSDARVVRILTRTLQASWREHVGFQTEVLFPIVEAHHGDEVCGAIARLRIDHASLSQRHGEVNRGLATLLEASPDNDGTLERLLRTTSAQRRTHFRRDAELDRWLPETFTRLECALCQRWSAARQSPRFPLNLLRSPERPYPRLGGRLN
jgi:hypothetical protein